MTVLGWRTSLGLFLFAGLQVISQLIVTSILIVTICLMAPLASVLILTITGIQLATLLGGVIVVEVVFAWPGLGRLVYNAVAARDYPVIQTLVLLFSLQFILINLIVDMLYAYINPTIRYK